MSATQPASPTATSNDSARVGRRPLRLVGIGRALLAALLCGLVGYFGGLVHGALRARAPEQRLAARISVLAHDLDGAQRELEQERKTLADLRSHSQLYSAYRSAERALRALDARNFGIAEAELRRTEHKVGALLPALPQLGPVQRRVAEAHVTVAENLAAQRTELLGVVMALDEAVSHREEEGFASMQAR
jgi:hypothetical protein